MKCLFPFSPTKSTNCLNYYAQCRSNAKGDTSELGAHECSNIFEAESREHCHFCACVSAVVCSFLGVLIPSTGN